MNLSLLYVYISQITDSVRNISKKTGINKMRVWRILNGNSEPRLDELVLLQSQGYLPGANPDSGEDTAED